MDNTSITCFGFKLTINNIEGLKELVNSCRPNIKWQNDLDTYYNDLLEKEKFEHHKNNCKLLSSLKNRIFADFEWQLLKEKWNAIKNNFRIVDSSDQQKAKEKYQNVTKIFTKEVWKKNRGDKRFSCPYAEINRVFVGLNRGVLCPIIDDDSIKKLIKGLRDAGYISVEEKILGAKKEDGGWLIRSAIICSLFKTINDGDNNKWETLPWSCLQLLSNKRIIELLENNHNIILTGAPGTGKTYMAQQVAEYFAGKEHVKNIQFHPSYDYTDLVEGMRPSGNNSFSRVDGSFKRFCKCAILGLNVNVSNKELADKEKGYTETSEPSNDPYVFIIDEINRGEVSKIFGEVSFCIEESHRGKEEAMDTQYQNLVPDGDLFKKGFYVPENVYVIGTMNDIDRSVESMDFAFRRRFAFIEIEATANMLDSMNIEESQVIENLKQQMKALNKEIVEPKYGLSTAYQIGGAYFLKFENYYSASNNNKKSAYKSLWDNHLKGTLFEYFRVLPQDDRKKYMTEMEKAFLGKYFEDKKTKTSKKEQPANTDNTDGQE